MDLKFAISLLLLCSLCHPMWSQLVEIRAADSAGNPVQNADVRIFYQKQNSVSYNDGLAQGRTDENGSFSAELSNRVPPEYEVRTVQAEVVSPYGAALKQSAEAGSGTLQFDFRFGFRLERVEVAVFEESSPAEGAVVSVPKISFRRSTGADGTTAFYVLGGEAFSGFVTYRDSSAVFSDDEPDAGAEARRVEVVFEKEAPPPAEQPKYWFNITFLGLDGKPLAGQEVKLSLNGENGTLAADPLGRILLLLNGSVQVNATVEKNEHAYEYSYLVNWTGSAREQLSPLLRIESFSTYEEDGRPNCHRLSARASDPRTYLPIEATVLKSTRNFNSTARTSVDETGAFYATVCISSDMQVQMNASNKYETASSQKIILRYAPPEPYAPPPKKQELTMEEIALWGASFIIIAGIAGAIFVARRPLRRTLRFIAEYLHQSFRFLFKGKRPPQLPKF